LRGAVNINRSRFGNCREYSASSQIRFDERPVQPAPASPLALSTALPPGVNIRLALDGRVRSAGAVVGAPVNAHLLSDVRHAGTVLAPKGTPVSGVLRQLTKTDSRFVVMIEFIELVLPGGNVPFRARLERIDAQGPGVQWLVPGEAGLMRLVHYGSTAAMDDAARSQQVKLDPLPGVAVLFVAGHSFDLSPGTPMTWVTLDDARQP